MVKLRILLISLVLFLDYSSAQAMEQVKRYLKPAAGIAAGGFAVYKIYRWYKGKPKTNADVSAESMQEGLEALKNAAKKVNESANENDSGERAMRLEQAQVLEEQRLEAEKQAQIAAAEAKKEEEERALLAQRLEQERREKELTLSKPAEVAFKSAGANLSSVQEKVQNLNAAASRIPVTTRVVSGPNPALKPSVSTSAASLQASSAPASKIPTLNGLGANVAKVAQDKGLGKGGNDQESVATGITLPISEIDAKWLRFLKHLEAQTKTDIDEKGNEVTRNVGKALKSGAEGLLEKQTLLMKGDRTTAKELIMKQKGFNG
jgi:hypothetical protein